jgi:WD40 repeat protein
MSGKELPPRPSLEYYHKQAKNLLKKYRAGDSEALQRVRQWHPLLGRREGAPVEREDILLADAQWVIAREHGFESWSKFVRHVQHVAVLASSALEAHPAASAVALDIETDEVHSCVVSPDGRHVLVGAQGTPVQLYDVRSGGRISAFANTTAGAWALAWSPDQRFVLIGGLDAKVRIWDLDSGQPIHVFEGHQEFIRCVAFSKNLDRFLSGSGRRRDPGLRIWDLRTERCLNVLEGHADGIYTVALDAQDRFALTGSRDTTVRLWDLEEGRCVRVLQGHTYHVHCVAWSPDQRHALSCSRDIRLWNVGDGRCTHVLDGHTDTIRSVMWSRDGRRALSGSHDGTVRFWDVDSGVCLRVFNHGDGVVNAVFSSDGRQVIACGWAGRLQTWDLPQ